MSLGTKLVQAVQKQTAMQRPLPLSATAHDELRGHGRVSAVVRLTDNDRLSHLAEEVLIRREGAKPIVPSSAASAGQKALRFVERATYLTESLQFVETDAGGAAIVRSSPQTMRAPRAPYFEARIDEAALSLKRYQPHQDKPGRAAIPFCVTDEVLTRLADDAAAVLMPRSKK